MNRKPPTGFVATDSQSRHEPRDIEKHSTDSVASTSDTLTIEEPLEIRITGPDFEEMALAITMRTPGRDHELALGFLFGEGIVRSIDEVDNIEHCRPPSPDRGIHNSICVSLSGSASFDPSLLDRHFYTSSSCGVCGKTSVEQVMEKQPTSIGTGFTVAANVVRDLPEKLRDQQTDFARTGGIHAAGLVNATGELTEVREDIGRHNAVDKLIGAALLQGELPYQTTGLVLSGRAGFELVQKAAMSGIQFIAGIGPPSSLSVQLAESTGITLAGFVSSTGFNVYCHGDRIS